MTRTTLIQTVLLVGAAVAAAACDQSTTPVYPPDTRVVLQSGDSELAPGDTTAVQLTAVPAIRAGLDTDAVTWTTSDTLIGGLTGDGRFAARAPGSVWVRAEWRGLRDSVRINVRQGFARFISGGNATCALDHADRLYCWTAGTTASVWGPPDDPGPVASSHLFSQVAAAGYPTFCAADPSGTGYCWGHPGTYGGLIPIGQQYPDAPTPELIPGSRQWAAFDLTDAAACGLTSAGALFCWGQSTAFDTSGVGAAIASPIPVDTVHAFTRLLVTSAFVCAATESSGWDCFGQNPYVRPDETSLVTFSFAPAHRCGLDADGVAYCWGSNEDGKLGIGESGGSAIDPTPVSGGLRFSAISAFLNVTCGLTRDEGRAYCWGQNTGGDLGTGDIGERRVPTLVKTGVRFVALRRSCGLTAGGRIWCWGGDSGASTHPSAEVPIRLPLPPED